MRPLFAALILVAFPLAFAGPARAADTVAACQARQGELAKKATDFKGDAMVKRIIQADLERATRELIEGDADECMEALDHATKLLNGQT